MNAWRPIARRGEFSLQVITRGRCMLDGRALDPRVMLLGLVFPEDSEAHSCAIGFESVALLREFIAELEPVEVVVRCAPDEPQLDVAHIVGSTLQ